jgi:hypothetical protein
MQELVVIKEIRPIGELILSDVERLHNCRFIITAQKLISLMDDSGRFKKPYNMAMINHTLSQKGFFLTPIEDMAAYYIEYKPITQKIEKNKKTGLLGLIKKITGKAESTEITTTMDNVSKGWVCHQKFT